MGSGSPWQTQDGQNLLLHLLLLTAAEPFEAGMDHCFCLLATQGEDEQEEHGPEVEERPVGSGGASVVVARVLLFYLAAKTG